MAAAIFYLWQYPSMPGEPAGEASAVHDIEQRIVAIDSRLSRLEQRPARTQSFPGFGAGGSSASCSDASDKNTPFGTVFDSFKSTASRLSVSCKSLLDTRWRIAPTMST